MFICFGSVYITYYKIAHLYFQTPNYRKILQIYDIALKGVERVFVKTAPLLLLSTADEISVIRLGILRCINGWGSRNGMPLVSRCGCEVPDPRRNH